MAIQRGKKWQVNIRFNNKLERRTFETKLEADQWELLCRDAREKGLPLPSASSDTLQSNTAFLGPFIDLVFHDLWGANKSADKYRDYTDELCRFYGRDYPLKKLTTAEYDRFMNHCREVRRNGDKTLNRKTAVLSKLLKRAKRDQHIKELPELTRRKEGVGRKRYMTEKEEADLIKTLNDIGHYEAAMRCQFMIYTGFRDGEVRNLKWNDITRRHATVGGKTGVRTITLPQKALDALKWSRDQENEVPFPMAYETFKEHWDEAAIRMKRGDDPTWVPYVMRHTCASRLVQRGVDLLRVSKWMGHKAFTTTLGYAHLAPDDLDKCADVFDMA